MGGNDDGDDGDGNNTDNDNNDDNDANDDASDLSDDFEFGALYNVHLSLERAQFHDVGSFCASDRADGTTMTPALPTMLGLRIDSVGNLPLPLSEFHARSLKSNRNSREIEDELYHRVHSVASNRIHIHNPAWE